MTSPEMDQTPVNRKLQLAPAIVISWNYRSVEVLCPYCERAHRHGVNSENEWPPSPQKVASRSPHCGPMRKMGERGRPAINFHGDYQIVYPFEKHQATQNYGFEIDAEAGVFRTVGLDMSKQIMRETMTTELDEELRLLEGHKRTDAYDLSKDLSNLDLDGQDSDQEAINQEEADLLLSYCIGGPLPELVGLFNSLPKNNRWLEWREETSTLLHYAAIEGHTDAVRFLLEQGADVNALNARKRTPLMEAALWGRTSTVYLLLKHRAGKELIDVAGYTALELAKDSIRNTVEREIRAPRLDVDKRECIAERRNTSTALGHTFIPQRSRESISVSSPTSVSAWKSKNPQVIGFNLQVAIAKRPVNKLTKTLAFLNLGKPYPGVSALSGWENTSDEKHLNAALWTSEVLNICRTMDYELPEHEHDQGIPGQFNACHAEKQLMAYFLRKHVVDSYDCPVISGKDLSDEDDSTQNVREISRAECKRTSRLDIFVSTSPCDDCEYWRQAIGQRFNVWFEFYPC